MNEMTDNSLGLADRGDSRKAFEVDTQKYVNVKLESFILSEYSLLVTLLL